LKNFIIFPVLFAVFPILFLFTNNLHILDLGQLVLPLIVVGILSIFFWIILGLKLKNYRKSGIIVSIFFILFFSYGHLSNSLDGFIIDNIERNIFLGISYFLVFSILTYFFIKTKRNLKNLTSIANVVAVAIIAITVVNFINFDTTVQNSFEVEKFDNFIPSEFNIEKYLDIYYIILDGHADLQTLKNIYNYDNSSFLEYLETNEFIIPQKSFSNYPATFMSLASSLNMEYISEQNSMKLDSKDRSLLYRLIDENKIMKYFKSRGYTTFSFNSGWDATMFVKEADVNLCGGSYFNTPFIVKIFSLSILNPVYTMFFESDSRERVLCAFSEIPQITIQTDTPVFVFAHILIPHSPYIFGPNGEKVSPETLEMGLSTWENKKGYLDQVKFVDKKIKEVVGKILDNSETSPIIIIQSDHGSAYTMNWEDPDQYMLQERFSILNAYYLPSGGEEIVYDGITPVNTFRQLLNYYFDEKYELLDDKSYYSNYDRPYDFKDVTEMLIEN